MKQKADIILMADIIRSREKDQKKLLNSFQDVIAYINKKEKKNILSPLTITLGDEFQAVIKDLASALNIIIAIEERLISLSTNFKLRYVLLEGNIETKLNREIAYGMLGSGLTAAREHLANMKSAKKRFYFSLEDTAKAGALNNIFVVFQGLTDGWNIKRDYYIVTEFLKQIDYKQVALNLNKEQSLMWKREKTLKLNEYFAVKEIVNYLGG